MLDDLPILVQSIFLAVEKTKYLEMGKLKEQNFMLKRVILTPRIRDSSYYSVTEKTG